MIPDKTPVQEVPFDLPPDIDTISPIHGMSERIEKVGDPVHSGFGESIDEMRRKHRDHVPDSLHFRMLCAIANCLDQVETRPLGSQRGVYLVTPEVKLPDPSVLALPVQEAATRWLPFHCDRFQVTFLTLEQFDRMIYKAAAVQANAMQDAWPVRELITQISPRSEVLVAVVQSGVHVWPKEWIRRKIRDTFIQIKR